MSKAKNASVSPAIVSPDEVWLPFGSAEKCCLACNRSFHSSEKRSTCPFDGTSLISLRARHLDYDFSNICDELYYLQGTSRRNYLYRGKDRSNGDYVVIKVAGCTPDRYHRFRQEHEILSQLDHPNIVRMRSYGETDSHVPFYIMDFIPGVTLNRFIQAGTFINDAGIDVETFTAIFGVVADAMTYAHDRGVVHWDFKPRDIMIGENCNPVILDFGKGEPWVHGDNRLQQATAQNDVFGDPLYLPPEACVGGDIDIRGNVYSLGCMMYAALEGHPPFTGNTWAEVAMLKWKEPAPPFSAATKAAVDPAVTELILRMLSKEPSQRPSSMQAIKDLLAR